MGFYDAKGYWRSDGDGFYDAKGHWVSPGGVFYDSKGYLRRPGDGFYDAKGHWVSPGGAFYDGKGYLRSGNSASSTSDTSNGIVAAIGFLLFIPIALLWVATISLIEWISSHLYIVYIGYAIIDVVICSILSKIKKHKNINFILSFVGNYACILSLIYVTLIYAVPYVVINGGGFGSFFEFTIVLAFGFGAIAVLQFFNFYHEKAIWEFVLGLVFFVIVTLLLKNNVEIQTIESLAQIYGVDVSALFKLLFGFVFM